MLVKLTKAQMAQAHQGASARGLIMRAAQIANQQVSKVQTSVDVELLGMKAELAVATVFQIDHNPIVLGVDNGTDLFLDDIGVDVKSSFHQNGQMLFRSSGHFRAEVCVLATATDKSDVMKVVGWLHRNEFLAKAKPSPNKKFTGIAVPQEQLRNLSTLWAAVTERRLSRGIYEA